MKGDVGSYIPPGVLSKVGSVGEYAKGVEDLRRGQWGCKIGAGWWGQVMFNEPKHVTKAYGE